MKIINTFGLLVWFTLSLLSAGRSSKTSEFASATNVLRTIEEFVSTNDRFPSSWEEVEAVFNISQIAGSFRYKSRIAFPVEPVRIKYRGIPSEIIAMSLDGQREGLVLREKEKEVIDEAGRLLILRREPEIFEIVRIDEIALQGLFEDSKISLLDYTGIEGKWANQQELMKAVNARSEIPDSALDKERDSMREPPSNISSEHQKRDSNERKSDGSITRYLNIWMLATTAFIAFCVIFILIIIGKIGNK